MKILLLSRYGSLGASSRIRTYQYLPYLESQGITVKVASLLNNDYVRGLYNGKPPILSVLGAYVTRFALMLRAGRFDAVWVEKEMLPWIPGWIETTLLPKQLPMVVDIDDAVFHRYDQHASRMVRGLLGKKIDAVMRRAQLVVVGNKYLEERARLAGARQVKLLPTVVDLSRYAPFVCESDRPITIGWIGSPTTAKYLDLVMPVLQNLIDSRRVRIVAVGADSEQFGAIPIELIPWSELTEVSELQQFDIGIMPLLDEPFERGKCGYKLIQYMACGKPVVASPVGVNLIMVENGVNGFLARNDREWTQALETLCDDASLRRRMGEIGRELVQREYSLDVAAPKIEKMLRSVVRV